MTHNSSTG